MKQRRGWLAVLFLAVCGGALYAALQARSAPQPAGLVAFAPQGALLALETPDFAGLLKSWTSSEQERSWLKSDNYAGFSRSRLFARLGEAQDEFAASAGLAPDARFAQQVAGGQSLFAWYDIGQLEFLYITRLPAGAAAKTPLLALREKFEERKAGDTAFYVRSQGEPARTVAFAVRGDYLLLATREDLLAGALELMQRPQPGTLAAEPWYVASTAAARGKPGDLRLTLNLAKIVPSPYFRSYWVQQNITELKQYSAALTDLYRGPKEFHEERVLIAKEPGDAAPAAANLAPVDMAPVDMAPVLAYLPPEAGAFRAEAAPAVDRVLEVLEDKLLTRRAAAYRDPHMAPAAQLTAVEAGTGGGFEERIDDPLVVSASRAEELGALRGVLTSAGVRSMLAMSSTQAETTEVFVPVHTAVVLSAAGWNRETLETGLTSALAPRLTMGTAGLQWEERGQGGVAWSRLNGLQGLSLAVRGGICVLASDDATLQQVLAASSGKAPPPQLARTVAGFRAGQVRPGFLRVAGLLDHAAAPSVGTGAAGPDGQVPPFFAGNAASLGESFRALDGETFSETVRQGLIVRQSVTYRWRQ